MGLTLGSAIFFNLTGLIFRRNLPVTRKHARKDDIGAHWTGAGANSIVYAFAAAVTFLSPRIALLLAATPLQSGCTGSLFFSFSVT